MDFQSDGLLIPGVHKLTGKEFIAAFCQGDECAPFAKAMVDLCDFSITRGATRILVGGSFVSKVPKPHDLDCVIVFEKENQLP